MSEKAKIEEAARTVNEALSSLLLDFTRETGLVVDRIYIESITNNNQGTFGYLPSLGFKL